eukprot:scaffold55028_cov61-Cyclotella_meneghiniana.AAC.1
MLGKQEVNKMRLHSGKKHGCKVSVRRNVTVRPWTESKYPHYRNCCAAWMLLSLVFFKSPPIRLLIS